MGVRQAAICAALDNPREVASVQEKIQSMEDASNKSVNTIDKEMSTALSDALLPICKMSSLKAKPWTTPESWPYKIVSVSSGKDSMLGGELLSDGRRWHYKSKFPTRQEPGGGIG